MNGLLGGIAGDLDLERLIQDFYAKQLQAGGKMAGVGGYGSGGAMGGGIGGGMPMPGKAMMGGGMVTAGLPALLGYLAYKRMF